MNASRAPQVKPVVGQRAALRAEQRARDAAPMRVRLSQVPVVAGLVYVLGMAALAGWAAWPIYNTGYFFVTVVGATLLGTGIAWLSMVRRWSWFLTVLVTLGAYLVAGVPLAVPSALGGGNDYLRGFADLLGRTVFGWKELATIALPVGSYQALLVPLFIVLLVTVTLSLSLIWRAPKADLLTVPLMLSATLFGIVFGSSLMSPSISIFGSLLPAPREIAIGLATFLLSLAFLSDRARRARSIQRSHAASATTVRSMGATARKASRTGLMIAVVATAVIVAVPVAAAPLRVDQRDVLRTALVPELQLREFVSPLSSYRSSFTDDAFDAELLTASAVGTSAESMSPTRLRVAVLSYYDGQVFRVVDPDRGVDERSTAFARMPGAASSPDSSQQIDVAIGGYSEVWMPLVENVERVSFAGPRKQALTDGFFYNDLSEAGVQLNTLQSGDRYVVTGAQGEPQLTLAEAKKPGNDAALFDSELIPESLKKWVVAQQLGARDGATLQELITRLRERGYLSHSLMPGGAEGYAWQRDRAGMDFAPSLAGHSLGRIDLLFNSLIDKQNSTTSTDNADLVAAFGDDEQFSVAAALLAESFGFPARVVVGFSLAPDATPAAASAMPACASGVCSGKNLTAWVEIQEAGGSWIAVDVTPQTRNPLALTDDQKRDPQNSTEVLSDGATEVTPPEAQPGGGGDAPEDQREEVVDLSWLFALLRGVGLGALALLILASPLIVMTIAKALRRRTRKKQSDATERIAGGWDEYVDTAVDFGLPAPGSRTRRELAQRYESPNGQMIAVLADEAIFGALSPSEAESDAYWAAVEEERALLAREFSWWKRLRARLSLRSFTRAFPVVRRRNE